MSHPVELAVTALVVAASAVLFGYWFRYTCLLILNAKTACDYAGQVAAAHQLSFPTVRARLNQASAIDLNTLHAAIERDYATLTRLLEGAESTELSIEMRMLDARYKMMNAWCRASRSLAPGSARRALDEMCSTVAYFANVLGERTA